MTDQFYFIGQKYTLDWLHVQKKGHPNPGKVPNGGNCLHAQKIRWPYQMTVRDGQWQLPHSDNENLMTLVHLPLMHRKCKQALKYTPATQNILCFIFLM